MCKTRTKRGRETGIMLSKLNDDYKQKLERFIKRYDAIDKKKKLLQEEIRLLNQKERRIRRPDWIKCLKPLIEKITKDVGATKIKTYGPFGLCNERSIYWEDAKGNTLANLCFIDGEKGMAFRDETKDSGKFEKGTIGYMNGMNHKTIKITPNMDYNWALRFAKRKRK